MSPWTDFLMIASALSALAVTLFQVRHQAVIIQALVISFPLSTLVLHTPDLAHQRIALSLFATSMIGWNLEYRIRSRSPLRFVYAVLIASAALVPYSALMKAYVPWLITATLITAMISVLSFSYRNRSSPSEKG
ncbi:hypothetical protein Mterra_00143 [Calidithermus terrae]|uniref:Uncharacterized protein n=1 Tax=Calidithermus terrae TaxID=1408545 RepID=A0A399F813_9DEIN|nr:hypothetical protein [Calidithermus terrae]RIH90771.1 hypothetical protein Mterra_00143 [Calidithermus terrae]